MYSAALAFVFTRFLYAIYMDTIGRTAKRKSENTMKWYRSGLMYTLNELANEGHTYAQREQLIKKGMSLLDAKEPAIETALEKMLADNDLILDGDAIYLPSFFYAEQGTASKLLRLIQAALRGKYRRTCP